MDATFLSHLKHKIVMNAFRLSATHARVFHAASLTLAALMLAGCAVYNGEKLAEDRATADTTDTTDTDVRYAWVELGSASQTIVRAVTKRDTCPVALIDSRRTQMNMRAPAGTAAQRTTASSAVDSKPSLFPAAVCEIRIPAGVREVRLGSRILPLPKAAPQRVVILGDTGCRLKKADDAWQACNDADAWPLPEIAARAAAMNPDLVLHVGDYHYRENACPADIAGCQASPWGYGWDAWEADFFKPAAALLASAPWVMVRGNHEECVRAGQGWFRFLDTQIYDHKRSCDDPANDKLANYSAPYAVALGSDTQVIVFDSSKAGRKILNESSEQFQIYQTQLRSVAQLAAKPGVGSIFVNHHPILAFAPLAGSAPAPGNQALQSVMQSIAPSVYFPAGVTTAIHGHVHDFQAISFKSGHPATLVSGNGGDNADLNFADPFPADATPAPGAIVDSMLHTSTFGFMLMERQANGGWIYKAYDRHASLMATCRQSGSKLTCDKSGYLNPS